MFYVHVGPRQQKPPQQDQQRPQLEDDVWTIATYNQRNKEKADSNASSCSSLVANLDTQAKTNNTYSRTLTAVLTHPDTQTHMSVANKPEFVKEFKESQVTLVGIGKGSGIPAYFAKLSFVLQAEAHTRSRPRVSTPKKHPQSFCLMKT
jgi:hypothetical protein